MNDAPVSTQFDLPVVQRAYREFSNLRILEQSGIAQRSAAVLISSNGMFFPNTEAGASRVLEEQDRFKWPRTLPLGIRRIVLVRDVYKTWYLRGISPATADPLALAALLKRELNGWDIQMAGVSSGGFAAVLFGCLVGARRVFSLAGQFSLEPLLEDPRQRDLNPFVVACSDDPARRIFLNLLPHFTGPIPEVYYLAPRHSAVDAPHRQLAQGESRIHLLDVNSDQHDANLLRPALRRIFQRSSAYLEALIQRTPAQGWDPLELSRRLAGNRLHYSYLVRRRRDLLMR